VGKGSAGRRGTPGSKGTARRGAAPARRAHPRLDATSAAIVEAFARGPLAAALVERGRIAVANAAFGRAFGREPEALRGQALAELLPPLEGEVPEPDPGVGRSYRTELAGVAARVDLAATSTAHEDGTRLVSVVLTPLLVGPDEAGDRALLALSRELAAARTEEDITAALARALEVLFPGRSFGIRLLEPSTFGLRTFYARGRLRGRAQARLSLRRAAVERTGLSRRALEDAGVLVVETDELLFEGCGSGSVVPLAVGGQLFGVVNLEYPLGGPGEREVDAPLLYQLANHAALGIRNVRQLLELSALKTFLEDLIENANALIFVVNRKRQVTVWNAALVALTGRARDRTAGEDVFALVPEDERRPLEAVLARGFAGEAVAGTETRLLGREAEEVRIAVNTAPVVGATGEVEAVVAIGQDLTLVRSLQAAAEHAERLAGIGRLVAGVVHELNNPLTAVNMYSDVLVEKLAQAGHDAADLEKLRAIREAGLRIQRLARDLVSYARPAGARVEPVELAAVLEEAVRLAKPALREASAVLEKVLEDVPPIEGSRPALVQVFVNLVTNAAQATSSGGRIRLRLGSDPGGEAVRVVVEDEGAGMDAETSRRAFEPFFTTRPGVGIGLGLPIVQGIVARHGGTVALRSAPGQGTAVTVTLAVTRGR
jgi:PAS domain S-box-containing protein